MSRESQATLRFYGALNDFLPRLRRGQIIRHSFDGQPSVKDMIESLGVPHPEVAHVAVNGGAVGFGYLVRDRDEIHVYPARYSPASHLDGSLWPDPPQPARFVLDIHLGRLAAYLRMLGFDTLYRNDYEDEELARVASAENRILLTRDVGLLKRGIVRHGYFVRSIVPEQQIRDVMQYYRLASQAEPFQRCIKCNGALIDVAKDEILEQLPANTAEVFDKFRQCPDCDQIYWRGSHLERMERLIDEIKADE